MYVLGDRGLPFYVVVSVLVTSLAYVVVGLSSSVLLSSVSSFSSLSVLALLSSVHVWYSSLFASHGLARFHCRRRLHQVS